MRIIYPTSTKEDREQTIKSLQKQVDNITKKHKVIFSDSILYGISDKRIWIVTMILGSIFTALLYYLEMNKSCIVTLILTIVVTITTFIFGIINEARETRMIKELERFQNTRMPAPYFLWKESGVHYQVVHIGDLINPQLLDILEYSKRKNINNALVEPAADSHEIQLTVGAISLNIDKKWFRQDSLFHDEVSSYGLSIPIIPSHRVNNFIYADDKLINFIMW